MIDKNAECKCAYFSVVDGNLVCSNCGKPSSSPKWKANVYGKAVEQLETENKGRLSPSGTKGQKGMHG